MESRGRGKSLISLFNKLKENDNKKEIFEVEKSLSKEKLQQDPEIFEDAEVKKEKNSNGWNRSVDQNSNNRRLSSLGSYSSSDESIDTATGCICNRVQRLIMCTNCNTWFKGRTRRQCPIHINVIHLMDLVNCHNCGMKLSIE